MLSNGLQVRETVFVPWLAESDGSQDLSEETASMLHSHRDKLVDFLLFLGLQLHQTLSEAAIVKAWLGRPLQVFLVYPLLQLFIC